MYFLHRSLLNDLVCDDNPIPDIVIDFDAKRIFCLGNAS